MYFQLENARVNYETQGLCSIDLPEDADKDQKIPLVIAVHGSNRGVNDYDECPFYAEQKKLALSKGCAFGVISNRFDTWGRDDGLYNLMLLVKYLTENYSVEKRVALWATSAGGILACRAIKEYPERFKAFIGTFPVYDLESTYKLNTCRVAWKAKSIEEFKTAIEGKNPCTFAEELKKCRFFVAHGTADAAVPFAENAVRMKNDLKDNLYLQTVEGGVHSTENFAFYGDAVEKAFEYICRDEL